MIALKCQTCDSTPPADLTEKKQQQQQRDVHINQQEKQPPFITLVPALQRWIFSTPEELNEIKRCTNKWQNRHHRAVIHLILNLVMFNYTALNMQP